MASKTLLLLGFLLAAMLLVSLEVAARELAEETQEKKTDLVDQKNGGGDQYPGHGGGGGGYPGHGGGGGGYPGHGGGGGGYPGHGGGGGGYPGHGGGGGYPGHGGGGGGGRCYRGCCRRGNFGGCQCCTHPDDVPDPEYQAEPRS